MAYSLVNHVAAGSVNTNDITTAAIDTSGSDILIAVTSYYATGTDSVTDSKGNTWVKLNDYTNGAFNRVTISYVKSATVGTNHTFTSSGANGSFPAIAVAAFSGSNTSAPFDQQNGSTSSDTPGSITPTTDNQLIISGISTLSGAGSAPTIDSGFTVTDSHGNAASAYAGYGLAYKIQTTAAAVNPTWTDGDVFRATNIASFKSSGAAPPVVVVVANNLTLLGVG